MQGKLVSLPSGDSFDSDDVRGSSATDGPMTAHPASDSTACAASSPAKQLAPLDVIREDEEDKPHELSPGNSLHSEVGSLLVATEIDAATPSLATKGFAKGGSAGSIRRDAAQEGLQGLQHIKQDISIQDRQIRD